MIAAYERFTHSASWEVSLGDEEIPGIPNRADAVTVAARKFEKFEVLDGDITSTVQYHMLPENEPHAKDAIDGAEIVAVEAVKDVAGVLLWWVAHGRS